jgi:Carboxypeptidase regulatory-like domain
LLAYGSPSEPITDAQAEIALLRRLAQMNDSGTIMGQVIQPIWNDNKWETSIPVPDCKIVAKQQANGREYAAFTDSDGHYEFEPLPPGSYHLSANTTDGLLAEEGTAGVRPRSCSLVGFQLEPDGRISGRVTAADGKPAKYVQVAIVPTSAGNLQFTSALTDELGRFEVKTLHPGRYLVGVGIQAQPGSSEWQSRVYYPGLRDRNIAVTIDLGRAEKRTNVDFQLPSSTAP